MRENLRSLSVILISVIPCRPKHAVPPSCVMKQLIFSGTSNISASIAKLCSSSSTLSSLTVKNVGISSVLLPAGIVTLIEVTLKSGPGGSEGDYM